MISQLSLLQPGVIKNVKNLMQMDQKGLKQSEGQLKVPKINRNDLKLVILEW